jgi:ribosomal protein S18 acetylase RimI-like enzyme
MEIKIQDWDKIDMQELVQFTFDALQAVPESKREDRTIETVKEYVADIRDSGDAVVLVAHTQEKLVGWLCLGKVSRDMVYIYSWHPVVHPEFNEDEVACNLIKKSIEYTIQQKRGRLEVFHMQMTDEMRPRYETYRTWYESQGMPKGCEWAYMTADLTTLDKEVTFPPTFYIRPITEVKNDDIYPCYYETFMESSDRRFLDQTDEQRRGNFEDEFFNRSNPFEKDASILLYYNEQIVGFIMIMLMEKDGFVNGIGIHPDFRRRGLGKALMLSSMKRAAKNGMKTMILEVDIDNDQAIKLYQRVGFKKIHGSISHVWKAE